jgi:DNA-binding beta-propeller fold protein YncE
MSFTAFARIVIAASLAAAALAAHAVPRFPPPSIQTTLTNVAGSMVAVNQAGMEAYVANESTGMVDVIDQFMHVTSIPVGQGPRYIAANSSGRFFVSNVLENTVSVRTGPNTAITVPVGGWGPIVMSPSGDRAYMARNGGVVVIINAATLAVSMIDTGLETRNSLGGVSVSADGKRLHVINTRGEGAVYDVSGATPTQPTLTFRVPVLTPTLGIAAGADHQFYVHSDGVIIELDDRFGAPRTFRIPGAGQMSGTISVGAGTVFAGFDNGIGMLDIATHNVAFLGSQRVHSIDSEPTSGLTLVTDSGPNLWVIDPRTMEIHALTMPSGPPALHQAKLIFKTCNAFVTAPVVTVVHAPCGDVYPSGINAQALWWVPEGAESGWGLNLAHQGSTLFGTWFTYDANGQPTWLVMSNGASSAGNRYAGTLFRTTGPPFNAAVFDPAKVTRTPAGSLEIGVVSVNSASMIATVDGATVSKPLAKQIFAAPVPICDTGASASGFLPVYQDLWWNPAESGWGLNVAHEGNVLFITWFTYDLDGSPTWFVGSDIAKTGNATYSGTLYKTFGPPMTASPWDPSKVTRMPVGNATLSFRDNDNGTFAYTVNGVAGSKSITRQVFATPVTRCR